MFEVKILRILKIVSVAFFLIEKDLEVEIKNGAPLQKNRLITKACFTLRNEIALRLADI